MRVAKRVRRCAWADHSPLMRAYHDREWGNPRHSDRVLFAFLILEGMQAGLGGHEHRRAAPWVSLRGPDHLLRVHAGRGHGERPYRRVLPPRPTPEIYPTTYATYTNYTTYTITCKDLKSRPEEIVLLIVS